MSSNGHTTEIVQADDPRTLERTEGFGEKSLAHRTETSSTAAAEQAKALVQARYVMALQRPRDMDLVRTRILKECRRPGFAATARYRKPVSGAPIEGPSIRFAETAMRLMGNIDVQSPVVYEDDDKRIVRITVTDLETNTSYSDDAIIQKTIERRRLKSGQTPLRKRTNSYGDTVYLLPASEDDMANKVNAAKSKAIRNSGLRILPADILEEAMRVCVQTASKEDAQDPDTQIKRVLDGFAGINVMPDSLAEYLGHPVAQSTASEIDELRTVYQAIKEGETSWHATLEARTGKSQAKGKGAKSVKDDLKRKKPDPDPTDEPEREPGED